MSSNNSFNRMANLNNKSLLRNYNNSSSNDRKGGGSGGATNDNAEFESWACESFNLIDYLGEDTSPLDACSPADGKELNEDDIQKQKEDALYSQFQYADMLMGDEHAQQQQHPHGSSHSQGAFGDMASVPTGFPGPGSDYEDQHPHHQSMYYPHNHHPNQRPDSRNNSSSTATTEQRFVQQQNLDALQPHVPSTSKASVIKQEPISEHEQMDVKMVLSAPTSSRESSVASSGIQTIVPGAATTAAGAAAPRPRKYMIKPDVEKQNPVYRIKRAKNNDAVRRSREKAKHVQEAKENELKFLQDDNFRKAEMIATLKVSNAQLQAENVLLKQNCRCGAIGRMGHKSNKRI